MQWFYGTCPCTKLGTHLYKRHHIIWLSLYFIFPNSTSIFVILSTQSTRKRHIIENKRYTVKMKRYTTDKKGCIAKNKEYTVEKRYITTYWECVYYTTSGCAPCSIHTFVFKNFPINWTQLPPQAQVSWTCLYSILCARASLLILK